MRDLFMPVLLCVLHLRFLFAYIARYATHPACMVLNSCLPDAIALALRGCFGIRHGAAGYPTGWG